ncbi:MAG: hypothetical protein HJJLKODD_00469 [Phycisphaerae bacterium]|nr:hypothetical protein [Phycisphaerae bacterium]
MNSSEHALISCLQEIKPQKIGFIELHTDLEGFCADILLDARYDLFASECLFDECTDAQAKTFLTGFVNREFNVGYGVLEQLSKLLSIRGRLISESIDPLLMTLDWNDFGSHQLFLSYLTLRDDGAVWAARLLDEVPEDFRDGLFLACYKLHSEELDRKLMVKFLQWDQEGGWAPTATGEIYALEQFIGKWINQYDYHDLEQVIRVYFKYRAAQ